MLIPYFQRLLTAEADANALVLASLESVPTDRRSGEEFTRALGLVAHIQIARRAWLGRLNGTPLKVDDWFPAWTVDRSRFEARDLDRLWENYFSLLDPAKLDDVLTYTASNGQTYSNHLRDVFTHVFNHSTYHRGQIARLVHQTGGQRAVTDFVALTRAKV